MNTHLSIEVTNAVGKDVNVVTVYLNLHKEILI